MNGRRHRAAGTGLLALAVGIMVVVAAGGGAVAHEGHTGPMITFLEQNEALKAMLPEGARITRRKQELKAPDAAWAKETLGVSVREGIHAYFLARDPDSGTVTGAAMVVEAKYDDGEVNLALGVNGNGMVTRAAVLSTHRMYVPEISSVVGKGFVDALDGLSVQDLSRRAGEAREDADRAVLSEFRDMAATLVTLMRAV